MTGMSLERRPKALCRDCSFLNTFLKSVLVMILWLKLPPVNLLTRLCLSAYAFKTIILTFTYILEHLLFEVLYLLVHTHDALLSIIQ